MLDQLRDEETDNDWRTTLAHALVHGDLQVVERDIRNNLSALTTKFTANIDRRKLEWSTIYWWKIESASAVFIAAMFGHSDTLKWLLDHGADRNLTCYLGQTALEMVGDCCEDPKRVEECRWLLMEAPRIPDCPANVRIEKHLGREKVSMKETYPTTNDEGQDILMEKDVVVTRYHCTLQLFWPTPLANGALLDLYEARFRSNAPIKGDTTGKQRKWEVKTSSHAKNRLDQGLALAHLTPDTEYTIMLRSRTPAGYSQWGAELVIQTLAIDA